MHPVVTNCYYFQVGSIGMEIECVDVDVHVAPFPFLCLCARWTKLVHGLALRKRKVQQDLEGGWNRKASFFLPKKHERARDDWNRIIGQVYSITMRFDCDL